MIETLLILTVVSTLNVVCFFIGAKVGQTVAKGEKIEAPSINPMEVIRARQNKKEAQREQDRYETILQNIENYDGTSNGQKDVPNI
jgi:hypothetical protein